MLPKRDIELGISSSMRGALLACLLLASLGLCSRAEESIKYIEDTDRFPGWKGELPSNPADQLAEALSQHATGETVGFGEKGKVRAFAGGTSLACQL